MAEDERPNQPTAGAEPITIPPLLFVTGYAGFCTVVVARNWATPRDGDPLVFLVVFLVVFGVLLGIPLLFHVVWAGLFRYVLAALPLWVVQGVPVIVMYLAGGWSGGWLLGAVGAAVGAATGAAVGWLSAWALVSEMNRLGVRRWVIGGWSGRGLCGVAGAVAWTAVGAAAGFFFLLRP